MRRDGASPDASRLTSHGSAAHRKYSRLLIPRGAEDEAVLGIVALYGPLGFVEEGHDLVACFREAETARNAGRALSASRIRCELVTDIPEGDPLEAFRAASQPFAVGRRFWIDPGDPSDALPPPGRIPLRLPASAACWEIFRALSLVASAAKSRWA